MSNFAIYMIGVIVVVAALGYGAFVLGVPPLWIGIGVAVIVGCGLMGAVKKTREPSRRR
ncbi:hypothetical protein [Salinisphaera aquimarina]|uniref:LysR family transcriptional regulator n=1 Tax=Salinisphaera aquimarina TaxID=2094031 RepID=A0ABV7EQ84_9GAMM